MSYGELISITGIDTDIGKSIVTGLIAKYLLREGRSVITSKLCQTGCSGISEDIITHRKIMKIEPFREDQEGLTCPYVFKKPCSPHLAARLENEKIDTAKIDKALLTLRKRFDFVLLEGVGGLMVPLSDNLLLIDYLKGLQCRHILVSSPRLGSINHTLSAIELIKSRDLDLVGIVYNSFNNEDADQQITQDSKHIFQKFLRQYGYKDTLIEVFSLKNSSETDFSSFFAE